MRAGRRPRCGPPTPGSSSSRCGRWARAARRSTARRGAGVDCAAERAGWTADGRSWPRHERLLLERALDWWGAVDGALGCPGGAAPQLRADIDAGALRGTLIALAKQVHAGHAAGMPVERIVAVTRLEPELIVEILERAPGELPDTR